MRFYEEGFIPHEFAPDWDYWSRNEIQDLSYLVEVSLGVNMKIIRDIAGWRAGSSYIHLLEASGKTFDEMIILRDEIFTATDELSAWVKGEVSEGELEKQPSKNPSNYRLRTRDYIEWLDKKKIPYPNEMKDYLESNADPDDSQLSSDGKSALTQKNATLKILFNKMVRLHYGKEVSAYAIEKDMVEKGIPASKNTIKKYLDVKK
jgi:hypothetical protein